MFYKTYTQELIFHEHNFQLLFESLNNIGCWQSLLEFKNFFLNNQKIFCLVLKKSHNLHT